MVYREDLREFRENGRTLFGLSQSLRDQGKTAEGRLVYEKFERAWKGGRRDLEGVDVSIRSIAAAGTGN